MTFIRAKEIPPKSGNWYDYEVMNFREGDGDKVRQKVVRYIGKSSGGALAGSGNLMASPSVVTTLDETKDARVFKMKTPARLVASALGMYYGEMAFDAIQQQFRQDHDLDMSESNYWNWVKRFTEDAIKETRDFQPTVGHTWVADETYMKLGKRNIYFWDIIERGYALPTGYKSFI